MFKLVPSTDPILKKKLSDVDFSKKIETPYGELTSEELFQHMKDALVRERGLGLSANQVGIDANMFVLGNPDDPESVVAVFNPKIVDYSDQFVDLEEGCLSFKEVFVSVKRPMEIRARYANQFGEVTTDRFTGITARVFLHEYDHLQGVTFRDHTSRIKWDMAVKKAAKRNPRL